LGYDVCSRRSRVEDHHILLRFPTPTYAIPPPPLGTGNEVYGNFDAGISLVETSGCSVSDNTMEDNRWGLRIILGSSDNVVSTCY